MVKNCILLSTTLNNSVNVHNSSVFKVSGSTIMKKRQIGFWFKRKLILFYFKVPTTYLSNVNYILIIPKRVFFSVSLFAMSSEIDKTFIKRAFQFKNFFSCSLVIVTKFWQLIDRADIISVILVVGTTRRNQNSYCLTKN